MWPVGFEALFVSLSRLPPSPLLLAFTPPRVAMLPDVGGSGWKLKAGRFIGTWGPHAGSHTL